MNRACLGFAVSLLLASVVFASPMSLDQLMEKVSSHQKQIKDMYSETTTIITTNMSVPGQDKKGPQKITQKGKIWSKGDKSRVEMLEPSQQITINNGTKVMIINKLTGQKLIQDLNKGNANQGSQNMSMEKAREYFNLSIKAEGDNYIITGIPKEKNKIFGRMEFIISANDLVPATILMYTPEGKLMSKTSLQYVEVSGIKVPCKNISDVSTPMGSMHIEMSYDNVKVNEGISDGLFVIEK